MKWREIFEKYPPGIYGESVSSTMNFRWFLYTDKRRIMLRSRFSEITTTDTNFDPEEGFKVIFYKDPEILCKQYQKLEDQHKGLIAPFLVSVLLGETDAS